LPPCPAEPAASSHGFEELMADASQTSASAASHSIDDLSVAHVDRAIANGCGFGIVSNHQHRLPELLIRLPQHVKNHVGVFSIKIASGLVCQNKCGMINECSRQSHTLLLSARELTRTMVEPSLQAKQCDDLVEVLPIHIAILATDLVRDGDVAHRIERRQQIELLEDKTDSAFAQSSALRVGELREVDIVDQDAATSRPSQAAENVEQCGLPTAGWPYNADELTALYIEARASQRRYLHLADVINLADVLCLNNVWHAKFQSTRLAR